MKYIDKAIIAFLILGLLHVAYIFKGNSITNMKKVDKNVTICFDDNCMNVTNFKYSENGVCIKFKYDNDDVVRCGAFTIYKQIIERDK